MRSRKIVKAVSAGGKPLLLLAALSAEQVWGNADPAAAAEVRIDRNFPAVAAPGPRRSMPYLRRN